MTASSPLKNDTISEVMKRWQSAALSHWKHIDGSLLVPAGRVWQAIHGVLIVLSEVETSLPQSPDTMPTALQPKASDSYSALNHTIVPPQDNTVFDMLHTSLYACAERIADLPLTWSDLRQLLHLLAVEIRHTLQPGESAKKPLSSSLLQETLLALTFYDGAIETLTSKVADICMTRLEERVASQQEQSLATQHLAERFLGNASHDLRTPLTAILGFAELLLEGTYGELTGPQSTTVAHIENSAQNLNEIISNMLDLLHIRAGKLALQYRPVDVGAMLQHLHLILLPLAERKKVQFLLEMPEELGSVEMDESIVRHILYHLLSSALRATPSAGEVLLRVRREPPWLILETHDTALHLPPEAIANMLDPFPRLENSPTRGYEGWEVGLPLVRRYVELHRGDLRMESLPEKGTIFYVTLPLKRPRPESSP